MSRVSAGSGGVGIFAGMLAAGGFTVVLLPLVGTGATILGALFVCLAVISGVTRLLLRLNPVEYGDRGGPS
jgi:hypothetical protein